MGLCLCMPTISQGWTVNACCSFLKVYSKDGQPNLRREPADLNAVEKEIFDFFIREENIDKLIKFLALEEHKGRDKFDPGRFAMFKGLFRNYGDAFL